MKKSSSSALFSVAQRRTSISTTKKIPRPMNCFMTFRVEKQKEILNKCPGANHRDISKIVAKWWREFPDHKKEPYRKMAALAKEKHLEQYPNYKYRPQKKTYKTRPYKKRPENEFTARDYQNKHQLFSLYHDGELTESYPDSDFLLDDKPKKITKATKNAKKPVEQYPSVGSTYPDSTSIYNADHLEYNSSPFNVVLMYPQQINDMLCNSGVSVPSPSVHSPSSSPYSSSYYTDNEMHLIESVNYQLQPENYGFIQPAVYSVPSHINTFNHFYEFDSQLLYANQPECYTLDHPDPSLAIYSEQPISAPHLLTTSFFYQ